VTTDLIQRFLSESRPGLSATEARDRLAAIAAAPALHDPASVSHLIAPEPSPELEHELCGEFSRRRAGYESDVLDRVQCHDRLAEVRAELAGRNLDGFIVPREDEYLGEWVPPHGKRLCWLTGFTGTFGWALVLDDDAAIFVPSLYELQVQEQVDGALFSHHKLTDDEHLDWLMERLQPGHRLGFDPRVHTAEDSTKLADVCLRCGAELVPCDPNPIDAVWRNQPPPPLAPVTAYSLEHAGEEAACKRRRMAAELESWKAHAAVIASPFSLAWLLNVRGGELQHVPVTFGHAILHDDATVHLFVDRRKLSDEVVEHLGTGVQVADPSGFGPTLTALGENQRSVVVNPKNTNTWIIDTLRSAGATLVERDEPCVLGRACKNEAEIAGARRAHLFDGAAFSNFLAWLDRERPEGVNELEAVEALNGFRFAQESLQDLSFPPIVAAGPHAAMPHYIPTQVTDLRAEPGSLLLIDSGGQFLGGTTDTTRTTVIGEPTNEHRDRFTRVLKGMIALSRCMFPEGVVGSQLDILARLPLWKIGANYDHGTGHGVGSYLAVHEGPHGIDSRSNTVKLQPGMLVTNEPGYYQPGGFGIRIENMLAVRRLETNGERPMLGFETLTMVPIDLDLVETALLSDDEAEWLDTYHKEVSSKLAPMVNQETLSWLERATRPCRQD